MSVKVGVNGFGRIGRLVIRAALRQSADVEFVAINDLTDAKTLAHLFKYDSVHGVFPGTVEVEDRRPGDRRAAHPRDRETDPAKLPWKELGVDVVLESTGRFTERAAAAKHLEAGAKKVIISRAGQRARRHHRAGRQRRDVRRRQARRDLQRLLHHQLPGADGQGPRRHLRHREGLR